MPLFFLPEHVTINVRIAIDAELLALLNRLADQNDDRQAAAKLSVDVKGNTAALAAVLQPKGA